MATLHTQPKPHSPIVRYFANWYQNTSQDLGLRVGIRLLQFALALKIMVLYSRDLRQFTAANATAPASWIYAEVVAALSIIVCLWCAFVNVTHRVLRLMVDFAIAILWAAQAGYFGILYWQDDGMGNAGRPKLASEKRMKASVTVGLVCVALWVLSFFQSAVWRCQALTQKLRNRRARKEAKRQRECEAGEMVSRRSLEPVLQNAADEVDNPESASNQEEADEIPPWIDEKRKQNDWIAQLDSTPSFEEESQDPPPAYGK
ncbi:hypothetical protein CERZMDRAFT_93193 [Cercospora zeae-maydis SCOH1-5]|uniref:MARVEL domain-containing protein n=1 Tax=Cercospora zeae-maydis SCOH1-5 TaxID=717836 RepID=A0A6A6FUI1_9PEZI|nr:hypothetical protein CERZMDRAFT_93193 [Cercospora zeae-maydis SCOH1-5]